MEANMAYCNQGMSVIRAFRDFGWFLFEKQVNRGSLTSLSGVENSCGEVLSSLHCHRCCHTGVCHVMIVQSFKLCN